LAKEAICASRGLASFGQTRDKSGAKLRVVNCVADRVWLSVPQFSKRQMSGNQIDAAMITAGRDFVNVRGMPACFTCLLLALMNSAL
jgi:hypothetical protein